MAYSNRKWFLTHVKPRRVYLISDIFCAIVRRPGSFRLLAQPCFCGMAKEGSVWKEHGAHWIRVTSNHTPCPRIPPHGERKESSYGPEGKGNCHWLSISHLRCNNIFTHLDPVPSSWAVVVVVVIFEMRWWSCPWDDDRVSWITIFLRTYLSAPALAYYKGHFFLMVYNF